MSGLALMAARRHLHAEMAQFNVAERERQPRVVLDVLRLSVKLASDEYNRVEAEALANAGEA